jgi:DNA adenine methylase
MKPILKWVGGKTQILQKVLDKFPLEINNYHEPFMGGGSVFLGVLASPSIKVNGKMYVSDVNPHLIALYKKVQTDPEGLIRDMELMCRDLSEERYYAVREEFKREPTPARFLYLNKTGFRGLYREGPNGFNVPFGHNKAPKVYDADNIREISRIIKDVVFTCQSFKESLERVGDARDFVYLDPPYAPENAASFVSYTSSGFGKAQHELLFGMTKSLPCPFLMSNSNVSLVREAFPEPQFSTEIVVARRAINSKDPSAQTNEVLIHSSSLVK